MRFLGNKKNEIKYREQNTQIASLGGAEKVTSFIYTPMADTDSIYFILMCLAGIFNSKVRQVVILPYPITNKCILNNFQELLKNLKNSCSKIFNRFDQTNIKS